MRNSAPLLTLFLLTLAGCISPRKIVFIDEGARVGPPTIRQLRAEGDLLRVTLVQDSAPAWVASVKADVLGGDVYLSTFHISSVVHATEFTIDLSGPKFPRDWRNRLYWVVGDSISSPINPFITHLREIRRVKILLHYGPTDENARSQVPRNETRHGRLADVGD